MPLHLNTSTLSMFASGQLSRANGEVATAVSRLSSGLRVQSARDDAAGLGTSVRLSVDAVASQRVSRGVNDGIGLVQTAEGGLGQVTAHLQRARELAVRAASPALSATDRVAVAAEYAGVLRGIDNLARNTRFIDIYPLLGTAPPPPPIATDTPHITDVFPVSGASVTLASGIRPVAYIPAGARDVQLDIDAFSADDDLQLFTRDGRHLAGTPLGDATWRNNGMSNAADLKAAVFTTANGFTADAAYDASSLLDGSSSYTDPATNPPTAGMSGVTNGMSLTYSGDGDHFDGTPDDGMIDSGRPRERLLIGETTEPVIVMVVGSGSFQARATWSAMPPKDAPPPPAADNRRVGPTEIVVGAGSNQGTQTVTVEPTPADLATLGLDASTLDSSASALAAMSAIDGALETVLAHRGVLAATSARFERALAALEAEFEHSQARRSRITDADHAAESSALARSKIIADASRAMLVQSRVTAEMALSLLRDR
jgi:flagellin